MTKELSYFDTFDDCITVKPYLNFYANNHNLYIGLMAYDEEIKADDHYSDLTVNIDDLPYLHSAVDITYNANNVMKFIKDHNLGEFTGQILYSGFCKYPVVKFNEAVLKELDPDMFQAYQKAYGVFIPQKENSSLQTKIDKANSLPNEKKRNDFNEKAQER